MTVYYDWGYTMIGLNDLNQPLAINVIINVFLDEKKTHKINQFTLTLPIIEKTETTVMHEDGTTETVVNENPIANTRDELIAKIETKIQEQLQAQEFVDLVNKKIAEIELAKRLTLL